MTILEDWDGPIDEFNFIEKEIIVSLPFPFDNLQLVITSNKKENEAQAKVELQDQKGKVIKTLISAHLSLRI